MSQDISFLKLNPLSRAKYFLEIKQKERLSYQKLAKKLAKSPSYIANTVRLLKLPEAIKDGLLGGLISEGHARALVVISDNREATEVYKVILKTHASVRETEALVRQALKNRPPSAAYKKRQTIKGKIEEIIDQRFSKVRVVETRHHLKIFLTKG